MHWETLRIKLIKTTKHSTHSLVHEHTFFCLILIVPSSSLRSLFGGTRSKNLYTFGFLIHKFDTYRSILYIDIYYIKL